MARERVHLSVRGCGGIGDTCARTVCGRLPACAHVCVCVCVCAQVNEMMEKCVTGAGVLIGALGGVETAASTLTANKDAAIAEVKWVFPPVWTVLGT